MSGLVDSSGQSGCAYRLTPSRSDRGVPLRLRAANDPEYDALARRLDAARGSHVSGVLPVRIVETPRPKAIRPCGSISTAAPSIPALISKSRGCSATCWKDICAPRAWCTIGAWFSVTFYDEQQPVDTFDSRLTSVDGWHKVRPGPACADERTGALRRDRAARGTDRRQGRPEGGGPVRRHLVCPLAADEPDDRRLLQHLYRSAASMEITCEISGSFDRDTADALRAGRFVRPKSDQRNQQLGTTWWPPKSSRRRCGGRRRTQGPASRRYGLEAPITEPGYYRVRATIQGLAGSILERDLCWR